MPPHTRNILTLAVLEGLVLMSAVMRFVFPELGGLDLSRPPQLIWFVGVIMLAGASVALYVVRAMPVLQRQRLGERVEDDFKQLLGISVSVLALAGLLSLLGPQTFERLLG